MLIPKYSPKLNIQELHNLQNSLSPTLTFLGSQSSSPQCREYSICPIVGCDIQSTKHLWGSDGFGIHPHFPVGGATVGHCLHQGVDTTGLARSGRSQGHHPVAYSLSLIQL